jgi:adenosylmethionine-8-amino-7-oxononanoate aminotransferase
MKSALFSRTRSVHGLTIRLVSKGGLRTLSHTFTALAIDDVNLCNVCIYLHSFLLNFSERERCFAMLAAGCLRRQRRHAPVITSGNTILTRAHFVNHHRLSVWFGAFLMPPGGLSRSLVNRSWPTQMLPLSPSQRLGGQHVVQTLPLPTQGYHGRRLVALSIFGAHSPA